MKIILIRHGETEYNQRHLFYGKTDVSLNEVGIQQARLLYKKLAGMKTEASIYTSYLKRTIETAELIFPNQTKIPLKDLDEKDFGLWEGLDADQINQRFPVEWQKWLSSPFEITPTNAEKFSDFQKRVLKCLRTILQKKQDFVIVGHLGVLRVILKYWFPEHNFWEIVLEQGNYTLVEIEDGFIKIIAWNK
ncbi:histidine phosphatase family protein [Enterococcus sp. DIV0756]|uniref:histidine phosphatase family protein n=1 Tax=Enterococcus sp. DIV0756 TaxID=2774636 RepID=UPI003F27E823